MGIVQEVETLRDDLRKLFLWAEDWHMMFNGVTFWIHVRVDLELGGKPLAHESERDLGVMVQSDFKVDQQCCKAANESYGKLGMIKRGFKSKSRVLMRPLYKAMVRPHLDYFIQA